jgi:ketosteroid isomerase-like protein
MTPNKQTVAEYLAGFGESDHERILACLTDDVEWVLPGSFHITGKEAFDREIENEAFVGSPMILLIRLVEQDDVVVAEGTVHTRRKGGAALDLAFCDVFELRDAKIRRLTSYLMELPAAGAQPG